jgi:hypothetical protein
VPVLSLEQVLQSALEALSVFLDLEFLAQIAHFDCVHAIHPFKGFGGEAADLPETKRTNYNE